MLFTLTKWLMSLPDGLLLWMSGKPQITDSGGRKMDPGQQLLAAISIKQNLMSIDASLSVPEHRELWKQQLRPFAKPPVKGVQHRDLQVDVGGETIPVREYTPRGAGARCPALVFLHGGGFSVFDIEVYEGFCAFVAQELDIKVYSVGYRLAPEHPYPTPLDDCCKAFEWVFHHAKELGLDPSRISIGGSSAGGNMSAALCLKQRDSGGTLPRAQLLIYPSTDLQSAFPSNEEFAEGQLITRHHVEWFHNSYVPRPEQMKEPYASPLLATDHAGLPPAVVVTGGFDLIRDEGEAYASALENAGVSVQYKEFSSLGHGFITAEALPAVRAANQAICAMLRTVM